MRVTGYHCDFPIHPQRTMVYAVCMHPQRQHCHYIHTHLFSDNIIAPTMCQSWTRLYKACGHTASLLIPPCHSYPNCKSKQKAISSEEKCQSCINETKRETSKASNQPPKLTHSRLPIRVVERPAEFRVYRPDSSDVAFFELTRNTSVTSRSIFNPSLTNISLQHLHNHRTSFYSPHINQKEKEQCVNVTTTSTLAGAR